jgi:hypothetical protein
VFDAIVGRCVKLYDVERGVLLKSCATGALAAGFEIGCEALTVEYFGQNACRSGFAHPTRAAEQKGVSKVVLLDGVF